MTTDEEYRKSLEFVIAQCWLDGDTHTEVLEDGTQVYAYRHTLGVAWGVNGGEHGFNIKRGIRMEDGTDVLEM